MMCLLYQAASLAIVPSPPEEIGRWGLLGVFGLVGIFGGPANPVLQHPHRRALHDLVHRSPGVSLRRIVEQTGIPRTTVRHHLTFLARRRFLEMHTIGREICAFPPQVSEAERMRLRLVQTPRAQAILRLLQTTGSLTQMELQQHLLLSQAQVSRLVSRLGRAGLLQSEWSFGRRRYRLEQDRMRPA